MLQLLTSETPHSMKYLFSLSLNSFYCTNYILQVIKYIEEGKRLEQPEKCPDLVYKEMCKCWTKEPKQRPTFKDLNIHFESNQEYASTAEMMKQLKKNKKTLVF